MIFNIVIFQLISGTAISTHLLSQIQYLNISKPKAVVLEAPFNNLRDEIQEHPFATVSGIKH
jgi:hypothetical protein